MAFKELIHEEQQLKGKLRNGPEMSSLGVIHALGTNLEAKPECKMLNCIPVFFESQLQTNHIDHFHIRLGV